MSLLNQVLTDRAQSFVESAKAQARTNIGAAAATAVGIQTVYHDTSLTGDGLNTQLGVNNYDNLATTSWVNSQGFITAQGAELSAGRGIYINNHVISTPSSLQATTSTTVGTSSIELPITSQMQIPGKGSWTTLQQAAQGMGPVNTLYLFHYVPTASSGTFAVDNSGNWQPVLKNGDDITANSLLVTGLGPDVTSTTNIDYNGIRFVYSAEDEDEEGHATYYTASAKLDMNDMKFQDYSGRSFSLTGGVAHDASLVGKGNAVTDLKVSRRPILCVAEWTKDWGTGPSMDSYMTDDWTNKFSNRDDVDISVNTSGRPQIRNGSGKTLHVKASLKVVPQVSNPLDGIYMSTLSIGNTAGIGPASLFEDVNIYNSSSTAFNCCAQWLWLRDSAGSTYSPTESFSVKLILTVEGYSED